jgi:hypothetical protein
MSSHLSLYFRAVVLERLPMKPEHSAYHGTLIMRKRALLRLDSLLTTRLSVLCLVPSAKPLLAVPPLAATAREAFTTAHPTNRRGTDSILETYLLD